MVIRWIGDVVMAQDMPTENVNFPCYWMYCDDDGSWRWTYFFARKGEKIAVSCEAYPSTNDCQRDRHHEGVFRGLCGDGRTVCHRYRL